MQFTQGLHRAVQQKPDSIATVCQGRIKTYREVHDRVARLAGGLVRTGIRRGDRICILSLNSDRYLEAYLAIAWVGAVATPTNFRWSTAEIIYALNDSNCLAMIVDDHCTPQVEAIRNGCPALRQVIFAGDGEQPAGASSFEEMTANGEPIPDLEIGGDELFGVFYTGGTTGTPKGVMLSHLNVCSSALALMAEGAFLEGAMGLHTAPMFHLADMAMVTGLLLRGGGHVMLPAFSPEVVFDLVESHQVTDILLVPTMLQMLVDFPGMQERNLSSLKRVVYGASPASEALLDRVAKVLPNASFMQGYGMTETAALIAVLPPAMHTPEGRKQGKLRSCGRSTYHAQMRIVGDDDRELPRGEVGEIIARGPNIMKGYLNKPEATEAALRHGWMHTGDMGHMDDDGYVFIVDRLKDMIISGGENIYSVEVENAVAKHPGIAATAVIGIPGTDMGETVHAVVVLKPGATLTLEDLQSHCKGLIAGYKCPRSLEIREALPMSGVGKVLKTELRKPFWDDRDRAVS